MLKALILRVLCQSHSDIDFVIKYKAKNFNSVDASFKRFDYQNINIEITKLLSIFQKKLSMIDSINADVITRICTLCVAVSRNFRSKNASFEIEFLKNRKNETFKSISFHVKKIENQDVVLNVFRLTKMTHLYVMSTTNLFYLKDSSSETESRDLKINLLRSCSSSHEFRTISNIFQLKRLYRPAITIYLLRMRFAISLSHSSNHSIKNERRIYIDRSFE